MKNNKNKYPKNSDEDNEDNNRNHKNENDEIRQSVFLRLKKHLKEIESELRYQLGKIFPINNQVRNLESEVGGTEIDYKAVDKKNDEDKDVWDDLAKQNAAAAAETGDEDSFNSSQNKSFIHRKKKGRGKKGKLGPMILAQDDPKLKSLTYAKKIRLLRKLSKSDQMDGKNIDGRE